MFLHTIWLLASIFLLYTKFESNQEVDILKTMMMTSAPQHLDCWGEAQDKSAEKARFQRADGSSADPGGALLYSGKLSTWSLEIELPCGDVNLWKVEPQFSKHLPLHK